MNSVERLGNVFLLVGMLLYLVSHVLFVATAFRMSFAAGIAALFFGCFFYAAMVFMNPKYSWKPLIVGVVGIAFMLTALTLWGVANDATVPP